MYLFYVFALIPVFIGLYLHHKNKNISAHEWLCGSIISFILAGSLHLFAVHSMTEDIETWSGEIVSARHFPRWHEYYEYAVYRTECTTDSKGYTHCRQVFSHWQSTSRWHEEYFEAYSNIDTYYTISKAKFNYFVDKFKDHRAIKGKRYTFEHNSRMLSGDPNDYVTYNKTGWVEPITRLVAFSNRIKAAPSVFSFVSVPENIPVYEYPPNNNSWSSNRLCGIAQQHFNQFTFDQFNSRLGPTKQVNVIIAGFADKNSSLAEYQKAKWLGGRKNDICILYGWSTKKNKVIWCKVFGWSESDICKKNLETLVLKNTPNNDLLPLLEKEIWKNYKIKDWSKFDYIAIEPRTTHLVWFFVLTIIIQGGLYHYFHMNDVPYHKQYWRKYDSLFSR